jgi:hypothetical protein
MDATSRSRRLLLARHIIHHPRGFPLVFAGPRQIHRRAVSTFLDVSPTRENHWRALALFGRNVASYKFALGQALLELKDCPDDRVQLENLALPYATALCTHLKTAPSRSRASRANSSTDAVISTKASSTKTSFAM